MHLQVSQIVYIPCSTESDHEDAMVCSHLFDIPLMPHISLHSSSEVPSFVELAVY